MDAVTDQISDGDMARKTRKRLKTSFNEAFEAHDKAMRSQSDIAKYNSSVLRKLEKAFAANPDVNLLSKISTSYASALEDFAKDSAHEYGQSDGLLRHLGCSETLPLRRFTRGSFPTGQTSQSRGFESNTT